MYCKAKKKFGAIRKFLKFFIFENLLHKKRLKGGISIYADFGPPRYVLWCCGGICHEVLTFFQIGCGHTVCNRQFKYSNNISKEFLNINFYKKADSGKFSEPNTILLDTTYYKGNRQCICCIESVTKSKVETKFFRYHTA